MVALDSDLSMQPSHSLPSLYRHEHVCPGNSFLRNHCSRKWGTIQNTFSWEAGMTVR